VKKVYAIRSLARQICKVSEFIDQLAMGAQDAEQDDGDVFDTYENMLMDELEHLQILTLKMTDTIIQEPNMPNIDEGDGSVFVTEELAGGKKEKKDNANEEDDE